MLIVHGRIVPMTPNGEILHDGAILIEQGKILAVGPADDLLARFPTEETLDADGQLVMPANICAHTHFYGAYARGMGIPGPAPADFPQILAKLWWGLDKALTPEDVYYSAMVCLIDAVRHGTTTLIDHHASPNAIDGSLDVIARAALEMGVRASLCYEVTDRDGPERAAAGIRENVRFIKAKGRDGDTHISALFGLHASLTLSEETLAACRKAAPDGTGFHIHVAEHSIDEYDSLAKCGMRVVDRLDRHGLLGPRSIVAHAVHVDPKEIEILARTNTWVTHQPRSNMNNAVGLPNVEGMLRAGVRVGLGNDGFSNAMWEEWKATYLSHKLHQRDPRAMGGGLVAQMAVENNAALVKELFDGLEVGRIVPGACADLILVDYNPYTPLTAGNLPWHILFGFNESMITTTLCAGKLLMVNRQLTMIDEYEVSARALERAPQIWERYLQIVDTNGSKHD